MIHTCVRPVISRIRSLHARVRSVFFVGLLAGPFLLVAQQPLPTEAHAVLLARDTGLYVQGRTFNRYTVPGLCVTAAGTEHDQVLKALSLRETAILNAATLVQESLPVRVRSVARACGARFTAAGTAAADLPDLLELALLMEDDTLARAVVARRLALASRMHARMQVWQDAIAQYLAAQPARVAEAKALVAQMDALGPAAFLDQAAAHMQLFLYGCAFLDTTVVWTERARLRALSRQIEVSQRVPYLRQFYERLMGVAILLAPDSVPGIVRQGQQDLGAIRGQQFDFAVAPLDSVRVELTPEAFRGLVRSEPAPRLRATYWSPGPGGDTVQPVSGKVSLYVYELGSGHSDPEHTFRPLQNNQGGWDRVVQVRHWLSLYEKSGLTVTTVDPTRGSSLLSGAQSPVDEAKSLAWYYQQYLKLPVTVAVQETPVIHMPDRRRYADKAAYLQRFGWKIDEMDVPLVTLVGRDGRLLYAGDVTPYFEVLLQRVMTGRLTGLLSASSGGQL